MKGLYKFFFRAKTNMQNYRYYLNMKVFGTEERQPMAFWIGDASECEIPRS